MACAPKSTVGLYRGGFATDGTITATERRGYSHRSGRTGSGEAWLFVFALGACQGRQPAEPVVLPSVPSQPSAVTSVAAGQSIDRNAVAPSVEGKKILTDLRARLVAGGGADAEQADPMLKAGLADGFQAGPGGLRPHFGTSVEPVSANLVLPQKSPAAFHLEDAQSGVAVEVSLKNAKPADAHVADGYVVYPRAHVSGATLLHRALPSGVEDFLSFEERPPVANVAYKVSLGERVAGLRMVANTLEMLDAGGAPRLRVAPPYLIGAKGDRTDAVLAVEGCAFDRSPAGPWGRRVTAPGARACTVRVSWGAGDVAYPAVLDPRWTTTGNMVSARQDHTATLLANGKVLVTGGRISNTGTTGLATAELFDRATGLWTATGSMTGGRWFHSAVQLGTTASTTTSGKVLIAGGITGTASMTTAQLYDPTAGTWVPAGALNVARHMHTATRLSDGRVLVAGGMTNTTVLNTAAIYNPASGAGTFTAVATTMASARRAHTATLLSSSNTNFNNKVLIVGGNSAGTTSLTSVQLFDGTGWSTSTVLPSTREGHTATVLANNNVLITGGKSVSTTLGTTLVFTIPASGTAATWPSAGTMTSIRSAHTATAFPSGILASGQVLVTGGRNATASLASAELWNGTTTWTATVTAMPAAVQGHTATLMSNSAVLIAGGLNGAATVNVGRIYDPSLGLTCTAGTQCASGFCANGVCCDQVCNGGCGVCNAAGFVGTCRPLSSVTSCRTAVSTCDVAETCNGTALTCPVDAFAPASTSCRVANGACDNAEMCAGTSSECPADGFKADGTICDDANANTSDDACRAGACVGTTDPAMVNGFEALGGWSIGAGGSGTIVGLNTNHTQGSKSIEVTAQNYVPFDSIRMGSLGSVGPLALLDIMLPTQQANLGWFGSVQLFVNAPSVGINNAFLGQAELTGLPLATWQTLAFQLTDDQVTRLSGSYTDLTFRIALNVPFNETGHYLFDNLRFTSDIFLSLQGIAKDSANVTKAIFRYTTASVPAINIPYGPANALSDQNGFIHAPLELPPQQFVSATHPAFVATLAGTQLTWKVGSHSVTATASSTTLPTETGPDGGKNAVLPDGTRVPLDTVAPTVADAIVPSNTSYSPGDIARDSNSPNPIGPTSAGTLSGTFQVTDDGSAEYVVPLDMPAGRNGVEPQLALVYNSRGTKLQSGDGFLGPGWALQGLHKISRCNTTFAYAYERNASPAPVMFDDTDAFCFDGERMVKVLPGEYRTKRDIGSKFVVTSSDSRGPVSFQVFRRDGLIETYGLGVNAARDVDRITSVTGSVPGTTSLSTATVRKEWLLSKVADRFGNTMTIGYRASSASSSLGLLNSVGGAALTTAPETISYTGNDLTGRSATKTVRFVYSLSLPRGVVKVASGVPAFTGAELLTSIAVSAPDPVKPAIVTTYKLVYEAPSITGRSLLTRIQRCGRDGVCMQPTQFTWEQGSYNFRHVLSDVDDSHRPDIAYGEVQAIRSMKSRFLVAADVNGDGRDDLIYRTFLPLDPNNMNGLKQTRIKVRFGGPNGFGPPTDTGIPTIIIPQEVEQFAGNFYHKPVPFDIDGDGRSDLSLGYSYAEVFNRRIFDTYLNNGSGVFARQPSGLTDDQYFDPLFNPEANSISRLTFFMPGDFNGDGRMDVARSLSDTTFGIRGNVSGVLNGSFVIPTLGTLSPGGQVPWDFNNSFGVMTADVDGDGRTEVVMGGFKPYAVHDDPNSANDAVLTNLTGITPAGANFFAGRRLDLNGDGLPDIIVRQTENDVARIWVNLGRTSSTTNHFIPVTDVNANLTDTNYSFDMVDGLVADLNDDGMDDILSPAGCHTTVSKAYISRGDGTFTKVPLVARDLDGGQTGNIPAGYGFGPFFGQEDAQQFCHNVMMDIDGDGQLDYVQPELGQQQSARLHIYFRDGKKPDRIKGILDGVGANTTIAYGRAGLDQIPETCLYPKSCAGRQVDVVSGYTVSEGRVPAGQAGTTQYEMSYYGSVADALGAGWLGFTTVGQKNLRTQVNHVKSFDLTTRYGTWYPFVGTPKVESTTFDLAGSGRRITRRRETTFTVIQSNSADFFGPYLVRPQKIDEREIEQAPGEAFSINNAQRWTEQNFTYDGFGNVKTHETVGKVTGGRDFVEYSVTNDTARWLINKVDRVTETSTAPSAETDQRVTSFAIDPVTGEVLSKTIQPDDPVLQLATSYSRNGEGLVSSVTETSVSGAVRTSRIAYDAIEGAWPAAETNALGQTTRSAYHCGLGVLASRTDPNGITSRWQYDGFGRRVATFDSSGFISHSFITRPADNLGMAILWTDSTTRSGALWIDELGREVLRTETAFDGEHQKRSIRVYDPISGKPQFVSRPFNATSINASTSISWTFAYDEAGRVTSVVPPGEAVHTIVYDRLKTTDLVAALAKGYRVEDSMGHVVLSAAIEPSSPAPNQEIQTRFDYGPFGNLRHVYQPGGSTLTLSYDHVGHRTQIIDPDAGSRNTIYNAFGDVEREQFPGQADIVYERDLLGRAFTLTSGDGLTRYQWDTASNGIGRLDNVSSPFGITTRYTYQPNGQLTTATWNVANTDFAFDLGYDSSGRPQTITYPSIGGGARFGIGLGYGGDGLIGSVSPAVGGTPFWAKTAVADDGQWRAESFGDGLLGLRDTDPVTGRVTHIATGTGSLVADPLGGQTFQNAVQSLGYGYYSDGKVQARRDLNLDTIETFTYDNVDRLKTWGVSSLESLVEYGYDDTGNLKSRRDSRPSGATLETYGYGGNGAGPHALTSGPSGSYGYDSSGRQTSRPGQPVLTYTSFDLPRQIQGASNGSSTFAYGAGGERVRKTTNTGEVITLEGLYERRVENGVTSHVFYLSAGHKIIGQVTCDGAGVCDPPVFYHHDPLGTVDTLTVNGAVFGRQKRDPFGRLYTPGNFTDPTPTVSLGFIGQPEDRQEGLINLNRRLYDANIGRFISPDPLVKSLLDGQAYNRFAYASNNPLSFIDPSGLLAVGSSDGDSESNPGSLQTIDGFSDTGAANDSGFEAATPVHFSDPGSVGAHQVVDAENPSSIGDSGQGYLSVHYHGEGTYYGRDSWGNWSKMPGGAAQGWNAPSAQAHGGSVVEPSFVGGAPASVGKMMLASFRDGHDGRSPSKNDAQPQKDPPKLGNSQLMLDVLQVFMTLVSRGKVQATKGGTAIGRFNKATGNIDGIRAGENSLVKHLPNQSSFQANWKQNAGVLRREMGKGQPIRDAAVDPTTGQLVEYPGTFLNAERELLREHGWTYSPATTQWSPP